MSDLTISTSRWLIKLTKTFLKGTPVATPVSVFTTLISQIAMMMAFLMPLKVVMLLGAENIPSYFPETLQAIGKNTLILSLVILSVASYAITVILKKISDKTTERGVKNLLEKTQKIIIFENQDNFASKAYTKYTDALAGLVFFVVTIGLLSIFYWDMAVFIIAVLFLAYFITYILYLSSPSLKTLINDKSQPTAISISNVVFLLVFLYIVFDFLYLTPPEFIIGLITIIIGRLMLVRLSFTASYLFTLKQDEGKINALFFHNQAFLPAINSHHKSVWDLLKNQALENWLVPLLQEATADKNIGDIANKWQQTRLNNIVVLQAESKVLEKTFLIKIFEERLASQALHESTLMLADLDSEFPCPPFLLATMIGSYHCHVFDITDHEFLPFQEAIKLNNVVNEKLLMFPPSETLVERYKRSKALLWERIDKAMMDRLRMVASEKGKQVIQEIEDAMPDIKSILRALPLSFIAPKPNHLSLLKDSDDQIISFHWPTWVIEPAGAGIDPKKNNDTNVKDAIQSAHGHRAELLQFPVENYELASLLSTFERNFHQQQYEDAIELLQQALTKFTELTPDKAEHRIPPSAQQ
ncbi:hypothetical protein [Methylophaga sp.]|uniref:hypothetical protein n=1 Tax=Methylophaga sp. TaxID=2024840 RepID=UPI0014007EE9|nr:hypothetical protein [Methylophaga sp.]MTI64705.1 hypothetical protein [Methylophaga sp.]